MLAASRSLFPFVRLISTCRIAHFRFGGWIFIDEYKGFVLILAAVGDCG